MPFSQLHSLFTRTPLTMTWASAQRDEYKRTEKHQDNQRGGLSCCPSARPRVAGCGSSTATEQRGRRETPLISSLLAIAAFASAELAVLPEFSDPLRSGGVGPKMVLIDVGKMRMGRIVGWPTSAAFVPHPSASGPPTAGTRTTSVHPQTARLGDLGTAILLCYAAVVLAPSRAATQATSTSPTPLRVSGS